MLADRIGIEHALTVMAFMPLLAASLALPLPPGTRPAAGAGARAAEVAGAEPE